MRNSWIFIIAAIACAAFIAVVAYNACFVGAPPHFGWNAMPFGFFFMPPMFMLLCMLIGGILMRGWHHR